MSRKWTLGISLVLAGLTLIASAWALAGRSRAAAEMAAPDWSQRVIRLHVVANSDSEADQALKRAVRDAILDEVTPLFVGVTTPEEARAAIAQATPRIEQVAAAVIAARGEHYAVHAELGRFAFPGKAYGTIFLPAGEYMALKVLIGDAKGANWWCVLFPPLCFTDWTTGLVLEPKPGTGGRDTIAMQRPRPQADDGNLRPAIPAGPALVDEEQAKPVTVRLGSWLLERVRHRRSAVAQ